MKITQSINKIFTTKILGARNLSGNLSQSFYQLEQNLQDYQSFEKFVFKHPAIKNLLKKYSLNFSSKLNKNYLIEALVHKSFVHEHPQLELNSYEKLEFLGDSILNLLLTKKSFMLYPDLSEGKLSKLKSAIVAKEPLSRLAKICRLDSCILMGKGEASKAVSINRLGDLFESVMGAIYLGHGFKRAESFLEQVLKEYQEVHKQNYLNLDLITSFDYKTRLQELTMKHFKELPKYHFSQTDEGLFKVSLELEGKTLCESSHLSKKEASKQAAFLGFKKLKLELDQESDNVNVNANGDNHVN